MELFTSHWNEIAGVVAAFILFFDRLSKLTPTNSDNKILNVFYRIFTILGVRVPDISTYQEVDDKNKPQ